MTNEEAKHKLDFMKKAYQKLIDEKVDSGKLVGDGVRGEWQAKTPLDEAYKDMIEALDLAIKALEQQQDIHDTCKKCIEFSEFEQQPRWIPVSERLPEDFEDVLVWYEYFRYGDYNRMFQTYGIGCYLSNMGAWSGDPGTGTKVKVFAWMSLPQPYKPESEDKE